MNSSFGYPLLQKKLNIVYFLVKTVFYTVESRFNDMLRGRQNYIVKPGYRYTEIPGITILWENF